MTSTGKVSHTLASQSRREALKEFGRYAAAAPTVMVLLEPRESHAGKGKRFKRFKRGKRGKRGNGDSHY
jgi:hypothetical protein